MRIFLTTYQGSGTYQIMPALGILANVVDRSMNSMMNMPKEIQCLPHKLNGAGIQETANELYKFKDSVFGHISFLPEYALALRSCQTKAIFNVRDPRDVIVSEFHKMKRMANNVAIHKDESMRFFLDLMYEDGQYTHDKDIIHELIIYSAARWPRWIGWLDQDFVLLVKYEDLRLNPKETLQRIIDWSDPFEFSSIEEMMEKLRPRKTNPTFRKGHVGEWKTTFSEEHKRLAKELLGDIVEKLGYER